jgi:hypothetical protein
MCRRIHPTRRALRLVTVLYAYAQRIDTRGYGRMDNSLHRLTVAEAATHLGITSDAVRQRIRRGSISHERDQDGKVYVYIQPDETRKDDRQIRA